ncbi:Serine acetyltransferase [Pectobacterium sp. F1-1]|uniref:acyltransferase n=1 Tax=Pectobacterium sp. F1-1 TaxID=2949614 RepID=UPI0021D7C00E|nr:DapH/DapD/GlmU-related protein [Pectobacterium sp. F1-1]UYA59607.1 Serine acetyltransferase [Pectobacterium sp. F1-1]
MALNVFNKITSLFYKLKTCFFYRFFFGAIGKGSCIRKPLFINKAKKIFIGKGFFIREQARLEVVGDGEISIGDFVSIEQNFHIISARKVTVGNYVVVSFDVMVTDIDHDYREVGVRILEQKNSIGITEIGDFCFIGAGAKIQAGTILGKQCVVGANAVIRGSFPDYCVIVGIPGRIIKRFNIKTNQWEKTNERGEFINDLQ